MRSDKRQRAYDLTGGRCFYCLHGLARDDEMVPSGIEDFLTAPPGKRFLEIDHAHPLSRGGPDREENILPACGSCNAQKRSKTVEEYRAWLSSRGNSPVLFFGEARP